METTVLRKKNNQMLLEELRGLVAQEKNLILQVLSYLQEVEARKLHLERGYSSMFSFCTEFLGYTEAEAHVRIQAARLGRDVPQLGQKIESGQISLSVAAMTQSAFRKENIKRKEHGQAKLSPAEKFRVLDQLQLHSKAQAEAKLGEIFQQKAPGKKVWIEIDETLERKLTDLKGLLAHKNFDGDMTKLVDLIADIALENLRKDKPERIPNRTEVNSLRQAKWKNSTEQRGQRRSRYISIRTRREVWQRAQGRCTFQDPTTGKRCNGRHGLEVDHIVEFARGGSHDIANLTLLCRAHNQARNRNLFD